jgi:hypothetical protein
LIFTPIQQHGVIHRNVVCTYHHSNNILNYMRYMTVNISMPTRSIESSVITSSENGIRQPHGHQNGRLPSLLFAGQQKWETRFPEFRKYQTWHFKPNLALPSYAKLGTAKFGPNLAFRPILAFGGNLALPSLTIDGQTIHIQNTIYSSIFRIPLNKQKAICCDKTQKTLRKKSESNVHRIFEERLPQTRNSPRWKLE